MDNKNELSLEQLKMVLPEEEERIEQDEIIHAKDISTIFHVTAHGILTDVLTSPSTGSTLVIPEGVVKITKDAFNSFADFTNIKFPSTLRYIAPQAFQKRNAFESIVLPEGLEEIGAYAFSGCTEIKEVTLPSTVKVINEGTFSECKNLMTVNMGSNIEDIKDYAFSGCTYLQHITVPTSTNHIGFCAFSGCKYLKALKCGNPNVQVEQGFISGCESLNFLINAPFTLNELVNGDTLFSVLRTSESYNFNPNIKKIGLGAFSHCDNLKTITIPENMIIGQGAFSNCLNLETACLKEGITEVPVSCFMQDIKLKIVTLPSTISVINVCAFANCRSLQTVHKGNYIKQIASNAFYNCDNLIM